jgi:hypothetical protein
MMDFNAPCTKLEASAIWDSVPADVLRSIAESDFSRDDSWPYPVVSAMDLENQRVLAVDVRLLLHVHAKKQSVCEFLRSEQRAAFEEPRQ